MTETLEPLKTVSFREVHAELERESTFLNSNHNVATFKEKGNFLSKIGFSNSIATKLYTAVAENAEIVKDYAHRYMEMYKFILNPQLERVCEKYNLFVRGLDMFLADIPEKNIKHMMDFKFYISDLPDKVLLYLYHTEYFNSKFKTELTSSTRIEEFREISLLGNGQTFLVPTSIKMSLLEFKEIIDSKAPELMNRLRKRGVVWTTNESNIWKLINNLFGLLEIAAIPSMFSPIAFEKSQARILDDEFMEAAAKSIVDLDPIVMLKTQHGRIIITAWGDEANDELVANPKFN